MILTSLLVLLAYLSPNAGAATRVVINLLNQTFGWLGWTIPIAVIAIGVWLLWRHFGDQLPEIDPVRLAGIAVFFLGLLTLLHASAVEFRPIGPAYVNPTIADQAARFADARECPVSVQPLLEAGYVPVQVYLSPLGIAQCGHGGGHVGFFLMSNIVRYLGAPGVFLLSIVSVLAGGMLVARLTLDDAMKGAKTGYETLQERRAERRALLASLAADEEEEIEEANKKSRTNRREKASGNAKGGVNTAANAGVAPGVSKPQAPGRPAVAKSPSAKGSPAKSEEKKSSELQGRPSIVTGKGPAGRPASPNKPGAPNAKPAGAAVAASMSAPGRPGGAAPQKEPERQSGQTNNVPERAGSSPSKQPSTKQPETKVPSSAGRPGGLPGSSPGKSPAGGAPNRPGSPGRPGNKPPQPASPSRPGGAASQSGLPGNKRPSSIADAKDDKTSGDEKPKRPGGAPTGRPRPSGLPAPPRPGQSSTRAKTDTPSEDAKKDDDKSELGKAKGSTAQEAQADAAVGAPPNTDAKQDENKDASSGKSARPPRPEGLPGARSPAPRSAPPNSSRPSGRTFGPSGGLGASKPVPKPGAAEVKTANAQGKAEAKVEDKIVFDDTAKQDDPLKDAIDLEASVINDAGQSPPPKSLAKPDDAKRPKPLGNVPGTRKRPAVRPQAESPSKPGPGSRPSGGIPSRSGPPGGLKPSPPPGMKSGGSNKQPAAPLSNLPGRPGGPPPGKPGGPALGAASLPTPGRPGGAEPTESDKLSDPTSVKPAAAGPKSSATPKAEAAKPEAKPKKAEPPRVKSENGKKPSWELPDLEEALAPARARRLDEDELRKRAGIIEQTLSSFGAPGRVVEVNHGPVITQFGVEPDYIESRGGKRTKVKVGKISALSDDLALALAAPSIRIEAPVPGKGFVGVEVPNAEPSVVGLRDVMDTEKFQNSKGPLKLALGQDVSGNPVVADMPSMPHMLVAGTTGSGKSVCVNGIITSMLMMHSPDELRMIMVDPKRVELTNYNGIPHLMAPVVTDLERIVGVLKWVQREMDDRYRNFAMVGARNIVDFNKRVDRGAIENGEKLPYILVIVDELADLMMLAPDETERVITRLAQMARATGIHIILSTQRPSVDVVTGLIKANFPARIAFAVATGVDSRVILDSPGAEKLLGRGDMLFQPPDAPLPLRVQGVYVSDEEIDKVTNHWRKEAKRLGVPESKMRLGLGANSPTTMSGGGRSTPAEQQSLFSLKASGGNKDDEDDMFDEAVALVRDMEKASISLLQRHLRIGYTRAARLIDLMEERDVIGPHEGGSKPREVLDKDGKPIKTDG